MTSTLRPYDNDAKLWHVTKAMDNSALSIGTLCPPDGETWFDKKIEKWFVKTEAAKVRNHVRDRALRNEYRKALGKYHRQAQIPGQLPKEQFDILHLNVALEEMNPRKAAGPHGVQNAFLQHLPPIAKQCLLDLVSRSIVDSTTPAKWRLARLIPIKSRESKGCLGPYLSLLLWQG
eukprot:gb/GEZJ01006656.1/.p1 GENE.gb/GEZJ01006656.1/~~gb/GEZJ01006656.1/.p1  ORF type:complete len:176 (-),score=12.42 gb/GEZJ01006656.1/:131-658(-)